VIWIRRTIVLLPLALLVYFGIAFVTVRFTPPKKINQLTIGSTGEAKVLNPILYTTTSDGEVCSMVFRGLVKYDENINLVPDLAESWTITQTSTLFFGSEVDAGRASELINEQRTAWEKWSLESVRREGPRVVLRFGRAGTTYEEWLLPVLAPVKPLNVSFVRVSLKPNQTLDGETLTSALLLKRLSDVPSHYTFVNTSLEFDLVVAGETTTLVDRLKALLGTGKDGARGGCEVAEEFPVLNEPEIVFQVRQGVKWHDGQLFSARDVEFTYRMLMDEEIASPRRSDYELVRAVEVPDDHTLRVVYRKPYAPCLGSWGMGMLPRHILEGKNSKWWAENFDRRPVGVGAYQFDEWAPSQYIRLKRFDDYWEGRPHLDFVTIRIVPDMVAVRLLFESGELDYWGVDPHANKKFIDDPRYDVFRRTSQSYNYIGWNLRRPIFQDARVRRALAHAVNVPQMIEYIMYGQGEQSTGPFPPSMWYANPEVKPLVYDPAKAAALLEEAGWRRGSDGWLEKDGKKFEFTLITNHPNEIRKDIATLVQSDLKKLGIKVEVQLYEWATFIAQYINKHEFDAMVLGWALGFDYDQYQLWHSSQTGPGMLNHCNYVNKDVDRLMERARGEFDEGRARVDLWEMHRKIYDDQPYLFLFVPMSTAVMRKGEFRVKRPDGKGGWIDEAVRGTPVGFRVYQDWWYRVERQP
jgi:ABC-type transport system substrate-binding protein